MRDLLYMDERIELAKKMFMSTVTTSVDLLCSELNKKKIGDDITAENIFDTLAASMLSTLQSYVNKIGLDERVK